MRRLVTATTMLFLLSLLLVSCTKNYTIIRGLEQPIEATSSWQIGTIADELPTTLEPDKRPTKEHIDKFKNKLSSLLAKTDVFGGMQSTDGDGPRWIIKGAVLDYVKGSGAARFFLGFGAGQASLSIELMILDTKNDYIAFHGRFRGKANHYAETTDDMFYKVARDFVSALKKDMKKFR